MVRNGGMILFLAMKVQAAKKKGKELMENINGPVVMGTSKGLYDFFTAYSYVFPNSEIAYYNNNYKSILLEYLTGDEYYEIFLPKLYSNNVLNSCGFNCLSVNSISYRVFQNLFPGPA